MTMPVLTGSQVALALAVVQQAQRLVNEGTAPYGMLQAVRAFNAVAQGVPTGAITRAWRAYPIPRRVAHYLRTTGGSWTCGEICAAIGADRDHVRRTLSSLVRDGFVERIATSTLPRFTATDKEYTSRACVSAGIADVLEKHRRPLRAVEMVNEIGCGHSPVTRALQRLMRLGIVTKTKQDGVALYTLSPVESASRAHANRP